MEIHAFWRESLHSARVHPYREPAAPPSRADERAPAEEWAIAGLLAVLGGARVAIAIAGGEDFGVDATVAGILGLLGLVLLARIALRRP